jgi:hypothetical protein
MCIIKIAPSVALGQVVVYGSLYILYLKESVRVLYCIVLYSIRAPVALITVWQKARISAGVLAVVIATMRRKRRCR